MATSREILLQFRDIARKRGYTEKIVGDYAYRNPRNRKHFIRYLKSTKEGYIHYYDSAFGQVEYERID